MGESLDAVWGFQDIVQQIRIKMEEISTIETRHIFNTICDLRNVGSRLLLELFIEKYIRPKQSLETYFRSKAISKLITSCGDFTAFQKDIIYPPDGASPRIDKGGIPLICKLIRNLPLPSSDESVPDDEKSKRNPYVCAVEGLTKIFEETYDLGPSCVDAKTLEESSKNLRDIYKSIANDLPQEKRVTFFQSIDGEAQVPNTSSNPDTTNCKEESKTVENTTGNAEIPFHNWRLGQKIPLDANSFLPIKEDKLRSFYKYENESSKKKYLIKKLVFTHKDDDMGLKERYYRELYHETILHPHVLPIVAHVQSSSQYPRDMYLMYPYMENGSVRTNIECENKGEQFRPTANESNSSVWTRCIYQVASALDYLHNIGKHGLRGPVFHRNITSSKIRFDKCFNAKLCDFGRAVEAKYNAVEATAIHYFTAPGYHPSMPDRTCYKASYDVYSLCVVILEIVTGEVVRDENPFSDLKGASVYGHLLTKIKSRSELAKNVAKWNIEEVRDKLAQRAWEIFRMNEAEMAEVKAVDILKIIKVR
ncbi:hypothetical protein ACJMK2_039256, partial [Sinanodonta woodiana]